MLVSTTLSAFVSGSLPGDDSLYSIGLTSNGTISVPEMEVPTTLAAFVAGSGFGLYYN
jgi:hypothetical protein